MNAHSSTSDINTRELKNCLGKFAKGVTVVTWTEKNQERSGITVNSFTSVSMDPPLVLISIDRTANACSKLKNRPFVINILSADQEDLAKKFSGNRNIEPTISWEETNIGPRIINSLAHIECTPWQEYDGGDHTLYLGKVEDFSYTEQSGLISFGGKLLQT